MVAESNNERHQGHTHGQGTRLKSAGPTDRMSIPPTPCAWAKQRLNHDAWRTADRKSIHAIRMAELRPSDGRSISAKRSMASAGRTADGRSIHSARVGKAVAESAGRTADGLYIHAIRIGKTRQGSSVCALSRLQVKAINALQEKLEA